MNLSTATEQEIIKELKKRFTTGIVLVIAKEGDAGFQGSRWGKEKDLIYVLEVIKHDVVSQFKLQDKETPNDPSKPEDQM